MKKAFLLLATLLGWYTYAYSFQTDVSGIISSNTTWDLAGSPYTLTGDIQIAEGAILDIEPGVEIYGENNEIIIFGTLSAIGAELELVEFYDVEINPHSSSTEINFNIILNYTKISGGRLLAVYASSGYLEIKNSQLFYVGPTNDYIKVYAPRKDIFIEKNIFYSSSPLNLVASDTSTIHVTNNYFDHTNNDIGGYAVANVESYLSSDIKINGNTFANNDLEAIRITSRFYKDTLDVTGNYWNTTDEDTIGSMIHDKTDDLSLQGYANFENWLSTPSTEAPFLENKILQIPEDFSSIQTAFKKAIDGDTILVQPGTYFENLNLSGKGLVIGSLYLTTGDTSYISSTIIDGNAVGSVITLESTEEKTNIISGLTLQNGLADNGGGLYLSKAKINISNSVIKSNSATGTGGGIYARFTTSKLNNVSFVDNFSSTYGSAVYATQTSDFELNRTTITGNETNNGTPTIRVSASSFKVVDSKITKNIGHPIGITASNLSDGNEVSVSNSLIVGKDISTLIRVENESDVKVHNSTFVNNSITDIGQSSSLGGIWILRDASNLSFNNSILVGKRSDEYIQGYIDDAFSNLTITYTNTVTEDEYGSNNIKVDPLFIDSENGDYRLSNYSPAIGAGDPSTSTAFDIEGNPRPNPSGSNPDIGAYENTRSVPLAPPVPANVSVTVSNSKVDLSWETPIDLTYNLYRSETGSSSGFELVADSISATSYTDSLLSNGTTYYYKATSVIGNDESGDSDVVSATPKARRIEVFADGSGDFPTIQEAIDGSEDKDTVLVNPGTYNENINLNGKSIVLGSLFLTNNDTSYISSTIIDGMEMGSVIRVEKGEDSTLIISGLSIRGGTEGGLIISDSSPTITDSYIYNNSNIIPGGGLRLSSSGSHFKNLKIFDNQAIGTDAGGIYCSDSIVLFSNIELINNQAAIGAGGAQFYRCKGSINDILIANNYSDTEPSALNVDGDLELVINYSTITSNSSYISSVISNNGNGLKMLNSIISKNTSQTDGDKAIVKGDFEINNSILDQTWNNGLNNVVTDPLFVDPENGDYRLSDYSPAIGAGDPSTSTAFDIEGNPRPSPSGSNPDIGAYENERSEPLDLPAPTNITGSGGEFSISFNWDYDIALQPIAEGYEILRGSQLNNLVVIDSSDTESFVDSTISPGQTYYYAISMYSADGRKSPVSEAFQISSEDNAPVSTSSFDSELTGFKSVRLTWLQNSEADLGGYKIYRGVSGSGSTSLLTEIGIVTTYTDTDNLSNFTNYTYELAAVDTNGNESPRISTSIKTGDEVAPTAPSGVAAEGIPDKVNLSWEPSGEADFWKYRIYRGTSAQNLSLIDSVAKGSTSYTDNEVTNAIRYYYAITAVDSASGQDFDPANESGYSTIVDARPPDLVGPGQSEITTINSSNSTVQLSWEALTDGDLDKYRIYRGVSGNSLTRLDSVNAGTTSYTDNNVSNGVDYRYAVAGVDTLNNEGELSEVKIGAPRNIPPVVTSLSNLDVGSVSEPSREIELSADGSSDEDGTVESYSWLIEGEQVSTQPNYTHAFDQGSSLVELIIEDNDGAQDTASFYVNISSKDRGFGSENADAAGVSLIGFDYLFMPLQGGTMQIIDSKFNDRFDISVGGEIRSVSSIASDTTVYLSSTDRFVYSFDRRGVPEWETPLGGELQATPTIDTNRDRIYVGVSNNNIFAIDRSDGEVAWTYRLSSPITQPGVVVQGRYLLFLTVEGTGAYFDLDAEINNGELRPFGNIDLETNLASSPAIDKEGFIYASTLRGQVRKFVFKEEIDDRTTAVPEVSWSADVSTEFTASPVVGYDGTIYIGGNDSTLYALSGATGEIQWEFATKGSISTTATINAFGVIYIGDSTGRIYAIDETGEQLWYYQAEHPIGNATAYTKGELIFATTNGNIVSIYDGWRFEALKMVADKAPQWGTYQGNFRRTGDLAAEVSTSLEEEDLIPEDFTLSQNYPNPFNPTTKIQYGLPEASKVRLDVFNLLGQRVATLVDEKVKAGMHTVSFDASQLASGIYIYRLATSKAVFTKKLTLIK